MAKKIPIYVVAKLADEYCPFVASNLTDNYDMECHSSCATILIKQQERPLFQPANVVLFYVDGWNHDDLKADVQNLVDSQTHIKLYSILFIANSHQLPMIEDLIKEDDDFLTSDFTAEMLRYKINQLSHRSNALKKLTRDLHEASEIALLSMSNSSELGEVSRFILASYSCKDYEQLLDALFQTIVVFDVSCSALIVVDDSVVMRIADHCNGDVRKVMLKHHNLGRIHHLGSETIITFAHASLMIHNMPTENDSHYGRLLDNLTVLGNCFEARAKGIHAEQEASAASRAKTMFLATMSHELRTPMNSVIGFTERLIEKLEGRLNARETKQLQAIKRNGDHLLSVINDILDVSKIEAGKMEIRPEKFDAVELIRNIFLQLQPIAQNHHLSFSLKAPRTPIHVNADLTRLTQMVMNLVSNAIKYTQEGSVTVTITKETDDVIGECLTVAVLDTGIGISEADQQKLFGNFVQIDSELSRKVEGTGLGLAITMVFADMHGGKIDVESKQNQGSCFTLFIPLSENPNAPDVTLLTQEPRSQANTHSPIACGDGVVLF